MTQFADWPRFSSVKHPESCLELVDGIVKIGPKGREAGKQTWYLKKQN